MGDSSLCLIEKTKRVSQRIEQLSGRLGVKVVVFGKNLAQDVLNMIQVFVRI